MSFIDLGEITDAPPPEPSRRPLDLSWVRRVLPCLLVAAVTVAACVAAAGPDPGAPRQILGAVSGYPRTAAPALDGDALYAATATHLTRYDLGHGRLVYRTPVVLDSPPTALRVVAGTVFATVQSSSKVPAVTVAFDAATGARQWDHDGIVRHVLADGRALFDSGAAVEMATGRELWRTPGEYVLGPDGSPVLPLRTVRIKIDLSYVEKEFRTVSLVLAAPETGEDLVTRTVLTRRSVTDNLTEPWQLLQYPGVVLLEDPWGLTGRDPVTLAEVWRSTTRVRLFGGVRCGRLVCLSGSGPATPGPVTALDPTTGEARWQITVSGAVMTDGSFRRPGENALVLDPATGRTVEQLAGWRVLDADRRFTDRIPLARDVGGTHLLGLLDGPAHRVRLLLPVDGTVAGCDGNDRYLACVDMGGDLRAWSYGVH
ncbi:PQQ-binding-like beta-propeller repeat protein [Longispora sp. K20-0274]|uniref:outer membrane protein assembly factor BamB family protein n=1 Tax=Longispora sp. K20-0274 TaxID=3088255 RepID=UPI003999C864